MAKPLIVLLLMFAVGISPAQSRRPGVDAFLSRGAQLMQSHMFQQAAEQFKQALVLNPRDPRAHMQYAICLLSLGHNNEARQQFEKVRQLAGNSRFVTYYLGRLDLLSNNYPSAIERLSSISGDPPFPCWPEEPEPADRLVPFPRTDRRRQDRSRSYAGAVHVRE